MKQLIKPLLVLLLAIHVHGCSNTISRERNVSNTVTQLHGTLSLVYSELYYQKKAMLEKFNDRNNASVNNFVIVDGKTGALYTIDLIRMNPAVVNELFSKIDATGSKKKNGRKPIFIIKAKVTVSKPVDWETESSGWGTVYTPFKPERGVVIKKILDLKLVTTTKPRDCYEKGYPCSAPEYRKFENYCRPYLGGSNKKLPSYILDAPPCYNYFEKLKKLDQRMKEIKVNSATYQPYKRW